MVQALSGFITGGVIFGLGILFLWKWIHDFKSNFDALVNWVEARLERGSTEWDDYIRVKEEAQEDYTSHVKQRRRTAVVGLILFSSFLALLVVCLTHVLVGGLYSSYSLFPIPLLATSAFMCFAYLLSSDKCCVHESTSASDPKILLGIIFPSVSKNGSLRIVLGSMNPHNFSKKWIFDALLWLQRERRVNIQFLSGEPEWHRMSSKQLGRLMEFWILIEKHGLQDNVRFLQERPGLQFTLTDKLIRIEKEHPSWVEREKEKERGGDVSPIQNHIHLFDFLLIWMFRIKFKCLWEGATPATKVSYLQEKRRQTNHGKSS